MVDALAAVINKPAWIDLASSDPAGSRAFYSKVFGWQIDVQADPQYGGYALAKVAGKDVAGIGPKQMAEAPTAWTVYIGTDDVERLTAKVKTAGGNVIAPPMEVAGQGKMAVFQDPSGAFIAAWQPQAMRGFGTEGQNTFGWAELNARGLDKAVAFYASVFGWGSKVSPMGEGQPDYTEFLLSGDSIAGAMEMSPGMPPAVPSYWTVYFNVSDVDGSFKAAIGAGAKEMVSPVDFPGGRFAILMDPQGATFGLLKTTRS
jgi:predicted enzyme related to lactoylglutathione lyase